MSENKTKPTEASVETYLAAIADPARQQDCRELVKLMTRVSKQPPKMWGPGIVGFGSYHYKYESGREGDMCLAGFSSRKGDISVYLTNEFENRDELLAQLGKHKMAKACLYLRKLSDINLKILEQLISGSIAETKRRYP